MSPRQLLPILHIHPSALLQAPVAGMTCMVLGPAEQVTGAVEDGATLEAGLMLHTHDSSTPESWPSHPPHHRGVGWERCLMAYWPTGTTGVDLRKCV